MTTPVSDITNAFRTQSEWCTALGSPFTAHLMTVLADDIERGGPSLAVVGDFTGDPIAAALPLRFAAGLATLVQTGQEEDLEAFYPPNHKNYKSPNFIRIATNVIERHHGFLNAFTKLAVQTNEVARSACLLGGFLEISRATSMPLALLELGASAGLNLAWDQYHYRLGTAPWGPDTAAVQLKPEWSGGLPSLTETPRIVSRQGCDLRPIDLADPGFQRQAEAYIWPDQPERLCRFRQAADVIRHLGIVVDKQDAGTWLAQKLQERADTTARVIFHSIFWQYLPEDTKAEITDLITVAGQKATSASPVAWLRMEPEGAIGLPFIDLTLWPGGQTFRLGQCHPHGRFVTWQGIG